MTQSENKRAAATSCPAWTEGLFRALGVGADDTVDDVFQKSEQAANNLAPNTRKLWKWVLAAQAAAVLTPGTWLLLVRLNWPTSLAALFVTLSTLAIVIVCWWMRWRGMQHDWTRSRVVAEICRSLGATSGIDSRTTVEALDVAPSLRGIAQQLEQRLPEAEWRGLEKARARYARERVSDQIDYYRRKLADAEATRSRLNRTVTVSLDAALFLAIAGVVIAISPESSNWLRWSGSDYVLGILGMFLPLLALTTQLLGSYMELNRRVGRYAQILQFLEPMEGRLDAVSDKADLEDVMRRVERSLLGELVDWYYQSEHAQVYYRSGTSDPKKPGFRLKPTDSGGGFRKMATSGIEAGLSFVFKVLVGRVLVMGISVVLTTAWIAFQQKPDSVEIASVVRQEDGRLLSEPAQKASAAGWQPADANPTGGFVLIAHGLHDGVPANEAEAHWMGRMQTALRQRLGSASPEIVLVDWEKAAKPYAAPSTAAEQTLARVMDDIRLPEAGSRFLLDVSTIRTQAESIGEIVGFKLARAIRRDQLNRNVEMHFIGHSAGGFVVLHAALALMDIGLDPDKLQITLLDTPMPKKADLDRVASRHRVEFFKTSRLAVGVPARNTSPNYAYFELPLPEGMDPFMEAHSYAYRWFTGTILEAGAEGFNRSIILGRE